MTDQGRRLCILGLGFNVTEQQFHDFFVQFGRVEKVEIIRDSVGKSRGIGFVTFTNLESARTVLTESTRQQLEINGKRIDPKPAVGKEEMAKVKVDKHSPPSSLATTRVFIAKLPPQITTNDLINYFSSYGVVTDCYMPKNYQTQSERGIAFITFDSPSTVDMVMSTPHILGGAQIAVDKASPKSGDTFGKRASGGMGGHMGGHPMERGAPMLGRGMIPPAQIPPITPDNAYSDYLGLLKQLQLYEMAGFAPPQAAPAPFDGGVLRQYGGPRHPAVGGAPSYYGSGLM